MNISKKSVIVAKPELFRRVVTITLLSLMIFVCFSIPNPTEPQWKIINGLTAITLAFLASEITGFLDLNIPKFVKAGGAIAVFAFVFWSNKEYTVPMDLDDQVKVNRVDKRVTMSPENIRVQKYQ